MLRRALGTTAAISVMVISLNEFNVRTYMCMRVCMYVCVFLCETKSAVDLNRLFTFFTETSMRASVCTPRRKNISLVGVEKHVTYLEVHCSLWLVTL